MPVCTRVLITTSQSVPIVGNGDTTRMEENEFYAIETFGSTGKGYVIEHGACSHYMKDFHAPHVPLKTASAKNLLKHINKTFSTLGKPLPDSSTVPFSPCFSVLSSMAGAR